MERAFSIQRQFHKKYENWGLLTELPETLEWVFQFCKNICYLNTHLSTHQTTYKNFFSFLILQLTITAFMWDSLVRLSYLNAVPSPSHSPSIFWLSVWVPWALESLLILVTYFKRWPTLQKGLITNQVFLQHYEVYTYTKTDTRYPLDVYLNTKWLLFFFVFSDIILNSSWVRVWCDVICDRTNIQASQ